MKIALVLVPLVVLALIVGGIAFALHEFGVRLQDVRDIVIIALALSGIFFFVAAIAAAIGTFFVVRSLVGKVSNLLDEPVKPALEEIRGTLQEVRGTVAFVSDTAVSPVIRVVSVARGVRRAAMTFVRRGG